MKWRNMNKGIIRCHKNTESLFKANKLSQPNQLWVMKATKWCSVMQIWCKCTLVKQRAVFEAIARCNLLPHFSSENSSTLYQGRSLELQPETVDRLASLLHLITKKQGKKSDSERALKVWELVPSDRGYQPWLTVLVITRGRWTSFFPRIVTVAVRSKTFRRVIYRVSASSFPRNLRRTLFQHCGHLEAERWTLPTALTLSLTHSLTRLAS